MTTASPLQEATVPGTTTTLKLWKYQTDDKVPTFIVDEYISGVSTWSGVYQVEQRARDAANERWTLAYSTTPAYRQALRTQVRPEITDGYWEIEGEIYKVVWNQKRTSLYAKRLDIFEGVRSWTYVPGGMADLRKYGTRVQGDTVRAYGELYGQCMICGRTLTNEESIEAGIGPVCASRVQW